MIRTEASWGEGEVRVTADGTDALVVVDDFYNEDGEAMTVYLHTEDHNAQPVVLTFDGVWKLKYRGELA